MQPRRGCDSRLLLCFATIQNTSALSDLSHSYKLVLLKHREDIPYNGRTIREMEESNDKVGGMFSLIFTQGAQSINLCNTVLIITGFIKLQHM